METKRFAQFGTVTVILLSVILFISIGFAFTVSLTERVTMITIGIISLALFMSLLLFYKMDIEIDKAHISFKMGIGIIGKSYNISEIESCKPMKNSFIYGWGIHKIPNGWLYNVSGINSVELTFKNTGKIIRIGTNIPTEITNIVNGLMNNKQDSGTEDLSLNTSKSKSKNIYIVVILTLIITVIFNLYQYQPIKINLKKDRMEIIGMYGLPVKYTDIAVIDTLSQMPGIEMRTNGFALGKVCKGNFRLTNIGSALLFINYNISPFVQMSLKDRSLIYFNLKDHQSTIEAFKKIELKTKINSIN